VSDADSLITANTADKNPVLATEQDGEELLITQAYQIE
jgi:hypothetical protein